MFRHTESRLVALVVLIVLLAVDLHCWQPGVGGRRDLIDGQRAKGTDVEMFHGWPACYRAEVWLSDDMAAYRRVIRDAPLFFPQGRMSLGYRNFAAAPLLLDLLFAALSVLFAGIFTDCITDKKWSKSSVAVISAMTGTLAVLYSLADRLSVFL